MKESALQSCGRWTAVEYRNAQKADGSEREEELGGHSAPSHLGLGCFQLPLALGRDDLPGRKRTESQLLAIRNPWHEGARGGMSSSFIIRVERKGERR